MTRAGGLLAVAISVWGGHAYANGAFPDSIRIFAPADRPSEIVLATNFGLMMSKDDGANWDWVCEYGDGYLANLYQLAAPPSRRIFAVAPAGLAYTDDDACSWALAPDLKLTMVSDVFADPVNPSRVLALSSFINAGGEAKNGLFISTDAGGTFGQPKYLAPPEYTLQSVEVAASDADRIYLTAFRSSLGVVSSLVVRSDDGGTTWTASDVTAVTGDKIVRIAAIDPVDPQKVYFRVTGSEDAIGLTTDGGITMTLPLKATTSELTGFLRRSNGTILVSALDIFDGALHQSLDGGQSFSRMTTRLSIRALAERSGKLYVATDDVMDGFAVAVSSDDGETFQPLLRFDQIVGARKCGNLPELCASSCANLTNIGTFNPSACSTVAPPQDGGQDTAIAEPPSKPKGCGCDLGPASPAPLAGVIAFAIALVRRRRSHSRSLISKPVLVLVLVAVSVVVPAGCSAGTVGDNSGSGGQAASASVGAGGSAGSTTGAGGALTNANCLQIRTCASACTDEACVLSCIDTGSPAARMRYEELRTCSQTACPDQQDQTCRCEAECIFGPGACAEIQDMCAEGATDITCDKCM